MGKYYNPVGANDVVMPAYRIYVSDVYSHGYGQIAYFVYNHITKVKFEEFKEDGSTSALTIYMSDPDMTMMKWPITVFRENVTIVKLMIGVYGDMDVIFEGLVTTIEQDYQQTGDITLVVTCKDITYTMNRNAVNKVFYGVTYSDIVKKVAEKYGCTADVDDTTYIYNPQVKMGDIINQPGYSDLMLCKSIAEEIGYVFSFDSAKKKIIFKKPSNWAEEKSKVVEVDYKCGQYNLLSFRPKFNEYKYGREVKGTNLNINTLSTIGGPEVAKK